MLQMYECVVTKNFIFHLLCETILYGFKTTHKSVYPIILVSSLSSCEFQFSFFYYNITQILFT